MEDSEVFSSDFSDLTTSAASTAWTTSIASMTLTASFHQKIYWWSYPTPKWQTMVTSCGMDHQNANFLLIPDTLSVGGCWGHLNQMIWCYFFENRLKKLKFPNLMKPLSTMIKKVLILLPLRAIYFQAFHYETPCIFIRSSSLIHHFEGMKFMNFAYNYEVIGIIESIKQMVKTWNFVKNRAKVVKCTTLNINPSNKWDCHFT